MNSALVPPEQRENLARRVNGLPLLLNVPMQVEAMYFDPHATLDEHSAPNHIILVVIAGSGFVRLGGPNGETQPIRAGDAILWPAGLDHTVWTEDQSMQAIVVNTPEVPA
jgi:quercetin dioxygenase-like cupin family protein